VPGYFFEPLRFVVRFAPFFVPFRPPFFFVGIGSTLRNVVGVVRSNSRAQPLWRTIESAIQAVKEAAACITAIFRVKSDSLSV